MIFWYLKISKDQADFDSFLRSNFYIVKYRLYFIFYMYFQILVFQSFSFRPPTINVFKVEQKCNQRHIKKWYMLP